MKEICLVILSFLEIEINFFRWYQQIKSSFRDSLGNLNLKNQRKTKNLPYAILHSNKSFFNLLNISYIQSNSSRDLKIPPLLNILDKKKFTVKP